MADKKTIQSIKDISTALGTLTKNNYFAQIPTEKIKEIVDSNGFSLSPWMPAIKGDAGRTQALISKDPEAYIVMSWYKMGSGRYEIVAYVSTTNTLKQKSMNRKEANDAEKRVNDLLDKEINKKYHNAIPVSDIVNILDANGFDSDELDAIYTGPSGRSHDSIGSGKYLTLSWFKMEQTGRYEITAYVS